jgi:hypothetical protein
VLGVKPDTKALRIRGICNSRASWKLGEAVENRTSGYSRFPVDVGKHHRPQLLRRLDGRWEVACKDCRIVSDEPALIGIGLPVTNRFEAECIAQNHARLRRPGLLGPPQEKAKPGAYSPRSAA